MTTTSTATFTAYGRAVRRVLDRAFTRPRPVRAGDRVRTGTYPAFTNGRVKEWPLRPPGTRMVLVAAPPGTPRLAAGWAGVYGLSAVQPVRALRLPWQR